MSYADQIRVESDAKVMREQIADGIEENKSIADSTNFIAQEAKIQVDINTNQIANIVAHGTEGSLEEIVDLRTNKDGYVYDSAGEHIRSIDSSLADNTKRKEVA